MIKDLNVKPETIKLSVENTGSKFLGFGLGDVFLNLTPKPKATKAKIDKRDLIKLKNVCTSVQFSSVTQSCLTLCDPRDCSMPGFPVHHELLKLAQSLVHRVGDTI